MAVNFQRLNTSNFATAQQLQALINDSTQGADTTYSSNKIVGITGALSSLNTTQKGSLVGAVNEVDGNVGDMTQLTTSKKDSLVYAVNEVDGNVSDLYYSPGDSDSVSFYGGGFITGTSQNVRFTIYCKNMSNISQISFSDSSIVLRQSGSYLAGSASSSQTTGFSVSATKADDHTLIVTVLFDSPLSGTNNDSIAVQFNSTISFS